MPTTAVEVLHDDGRWYLAQLLGQHFDRATGEWRCGVRYTVDVGMQNQRVVWADQCRLPAEDEVEQRPHAHPGGQAADHDHRSAPVQAWGITSRVGSGVTWASERRPGRRALGNLPWG
jgi:hypothetical protein